MRKRCIEQIHFDHWLKWDTALCNNNIYIKIVYIRPTALRCQSIDLTMLTPLPLPSLRSIQIKKKNYSYIITAFKLRYITTAVTANFLCKRLCSFSLNTGYFYRYSKKRTNLVEAALAKDLKQLIGLFRLVSGYNARWFGWQRLPANQHHDIYSLLEKQYFGIFLLQDQKRKKGSNVVCITTNCIIVSYLGLLTLSIYYIFIKLKHYFILHSLFQIKITQQIISNILKQFTY